MSQVASKKARSRAVICCGILGAFVFSATQAQSAAGASALASQALANVDPAAAFLMSDLGISADEAANRLTIQEQTPDLDAELKATLPDSYAGLWIDQSAGGQVMVATKNPDDPKISAIASKHELRDVKVVSVRRSLIALEAMQRRLEPRARALRLGLGVDVTKNRLQIRKPSAVPADAIREVVANEPDDAITVVDGGGFATPQACKYTSCDAPLRAGVATFFSSVSDRGCTAGFMVKSNSDNRPYVLTAGHCAVTNPTYHGEFFNGYRPVIGLPHNGVFPGADYGILNVQNPAGWTPKPWVAVWGNQPGISDNFAYNIVGASGSTAGATVCYSGMMTGSSCGYVRRLNETVNYPDGSVRGLAAVQYNNVCNVDGDSGAPVWANSRAYGIHSGSTTEGGCEAYYQGVTAALSNLRVRLRTVSDD